MTSSRTRRTLTAAAAVALVVGTPGFVSVASAHNDDGKGGRGGLTSEITSNPELVAAITDARAVYKATMKEIKTTYRTAVEGDRDAIVAATETEREAFRSARQAYREARQSGDEATAKRAALKAAATALKDAVTAARAEQPGFTEAAATARTAMREALAAYQAAIETAFGVAGVEVPPRLLTPRFKHGKDAGAWIGHGFGTRLGHGARDDGNIQ
jgi:hypothetical protein